MKIQTIVVFGNLSSTSGFRKDFISIQLPTGTYTHYTASTQAFQVPLAPPLYRHMLMLRSRSHALIVECKRIIFHLFINHGTHLNSQATFSYKGGKADHCFSTSPSNQTFPPRWGPPMYEWDQGVVSARKTFSASRISLSRYQLPALPIVFSVLGCIHAVCKLESIVSVGFCFFAPVINLTA